MFNIITKIKNSRLFKSAILSSLTILLVFVVLFAVCSVSGLLRPSQSIAQSTGAFGSGGGAVTIINSILNDISFIEGLANGYVSIAQFGATTVDSVDNHNAIMNTITYAKAHGISTILFPSGTYWSSQITLSEVDSLDFVGQTGTVLKCLATFPADYATTTYYRSLFLVTSCEHLTFNNLSFDLSASTFYPKSHLYPIFVFDAGGSGTHSKYIKVLNCKFTDCSSIEFWGSSSDTSVWGAEISNCEFFPADTLTGVQFYTPGYMVTVDNNVYYGNGVGRQFVVGQPNQSSITNNKVYKCADSGIYLSSPDVLIANNLVKWAGKDGIKVTHSRGRNIVVNNNTVIGVGRCNRGSNVGYNFEASHVAMTGNVFEADTVGSGEADWFWDVQHGLMLGPNTDSSSFVANQFYGVGMMGGAKGGSGCRIGAGVTEITFASNTFAFFKYGIVNAGNDVKRIYVTPGNYFYGIRSNNIRFADSHTGVDVINLSGNIHRDSNYPIVVENVDTLNIENNWSYGTQDHNFITDQGGNTCFVSHNNERPGTAAVTFKDFTNSYITTGRLVSRDSVRSEGPVLVKGRLLARDSVGVGINLRVEGDALVKGSLNARGKIIAEDSMRVGTITPDDNFVPVVRLIGDADSDGSSVAKELCTLSLEGNADPTLSYWRFNSVYNRFKFSNSANDYATITTNNTSGILTINANTAGNWSLIKLGGTAVNSNLDYFIVMNASNYWRGDGVFNVYGNINTSNGWIQAQNGGLILNAAAANGEVPYIKLTSDFDATGAVSSGTLTIDALPNNNPGLGQIRFTSNNGRGFLFNLTVTTRDTVSAREAAGSVYTYFIPGGSLVTSSNPNQKENIVKKSLTGTDSLIAKLNIYDFNFKDDSLKSKHTGMMATEFYEISKYFGGNTNEINYEHVFAFLILHNKHLTKKVGELDAKVRGLEIRLSAMESGPKGDASFPGLNFYAPAKLSWFDKLMEFIMSIDRVLSPHPWDWIAHIILFGLLIFVLLYFSQLKHSVLAYWGLGTFLVLALEFIQKPLYGNISWVDYVVKHCIGDIIAGMVGMGIGLLVFLGFAVHYLKTSTDIVDEGVK